MTGKLLRSLLFLTMLLPVIGHPLSAQMISHPGAPPSRDAAFYTDKVLVFYSPTCGRCIDALDFFERAAVVYPGLPIVCLNIRHPDGRHNIDFLIALSHQFGLPDRGMPRIFIGNTNYAGFYQGGMRVEYSERYGGLFGFRGTLWRRLQAFAQKKGYPMADTEEARILAARGLVAPAATGPGRFWPLLLPLLSGLSWLVLRKRWKGSPQTRRYWLITTIFLLLLALILVLGTVPRDEVTRFARSLPFAPFVMAVALVDGFNPCAFTVLFILLSLLTYTRERARMLLIGTVFTVTSALMYYLFIIILALVGSIFLQHSGDVVLRILGVVVLIAGVINLKDFLYFKQGFSLTLSDKQQQRVGQQAGKISQAASGKALAAAIGGTFLLAVAVNLVELGCTAILPTVYIGALFKRFGAGPSPAHFLWTALYALMYIVPLVVVLTLFMFTFRSRRMTETQGRMLKLLGGVFMVVCGLVMLLLPELLLFR